ncbi:MAG: preprotein translocase subunit SecA [Flavobacteriales bacterium]|nr:preprotein translocase subunit SecA [Flavobacteriales bacterium]
MSILDKVMKFLLGDKSSKDIKIIMPIVDKISLFGSEMSKLSNDGLRLKTEGFKKMISDATSTQNEEIAKLRELANADGVDIHQKEEYYTKIDDLEDEAYKISEKILEDILPEAFALIRETSKRFAENDTIEVTATQLDRELSSKHQHIELIDDKAIWANAWDANGEIVKWEMIHYDVQMIGGVVLHEGKIAEMATGEGKTLVATLPVYLNALPGKGVHVVTVNDYLAKRDAAWMGPIFEFHGLRIDCIDHHQANSEERRNAYKSDITYGTNNEFGFDYLRDNMAHTPNDLVQRKHNYAIVDEVDSVLVDDARTPLIISGPVPKGDLHEFNELKPKIEKLVATQRQYLQNILSDAKRLYKEGHEDAGFNLFSVYRGLPKNKALIKFLSEEGVKALLQKTENYFIQDKEKEMYIVDDNLYFSIDEKNNSINLTDKGIDLLSGDTEDDFFIMPDIGMEIASIDNSDNNDEEKSRIKDELFRDYSIKSERIHSMNQLLKAYTLFEKDVEYVIMDNKIKIVDEQTGRIMDGRRYSDGLHQALEAKENVYIEAATQTFATITLQNYFRMYRKLSGMTGTAVTEAGEFWDIYKLDVVEIPTNRPIVRDDREDLVFKTKREKYNAVIQEVTKLSKAGRPVLVGTTSVEISELLGRLLKVNHIPHNVLNAKLHKKEADIVKEAGQPGIVTIATNMAGRGTDIKLTPEAKKAGGLAIVGTERHDSRRVDRQLRGRAGRQGDPGSSQFYVSLEDNLMRLFGSERIAKLMDRMGLEDGEVIQHSMISKSIERAQSKVEENNFGIRKRLLEYDDVMNSQRSVIYKRRHNALFGDRLAVDIANMIYDTSDEISISNKELNDFSNFKLDLAKFLSIESPVSKDEFDSMQADDISQKVYSEAYKHYIRKSKRTAESAYPVIKDVYENQGDKYVNIVIPFTDGVKQLQIVTNLKEAYETEGKQLNKDFEKNITLSIIDESWKTHLREMDELKQSVQNASYEQKDPLLIYKFESYELFKSMIDKVNKDVISFLLKGNLPEMEKPSQNIREAKELPRRREKLQESKEDLNESGRESQASQAHHTQAPPVQETFIRQDKKIGRNDRVTIKNVMNGESKSMKFKQAQVLINKGQWVLVDED